MAKVSSFSDCNRLADLKERRRYEGRLCGVGELNAHNGRRNLDELGAGLFPVTNYGSVARERYMGGILVW